MPARRLSALLLAAAATAACAVTGAPPLLVPGGAPGGEALRLDGVDGSRSGRVAFRGWVGAFERGFSTSLTNRWDQQRFDGSFQLSRGDQTAVGICAMREGLIEVPAPFLQTVKAPAVAYVYDCELEAGGRTGRLQIGEAVASTFQPSTERRGVAYLEGGPLLEVRSLHQFEGIGTRMGTPIGYGLFDGPRVVAVVDLTGTRPVLTLPGPDDPSAPVAELAGLALGFLVTE